MSEPAAVGRDLAGAAAAGAPRVRYFVGLKLRILRNGMRGSAMRILAFVMGGVFGLVGLVGGFALLLAVSAMSRTDVGMLVVTVVVALMVLGWLVFPLLAFGVDETLDPARFALLPIPRRRLLAGLLAAACVGIPPVVTLLATAGVVVGASTHGVVPGVVAAVGVLLGFGTCLVGSRALTSGLATILRSRRVRDLGVVVFALLAALIGPMQMVIGSLAQTGRLADALGTARIIGWTPLAAPYVAWFDVVAGRPGAAAGKLAVAAVTVALLLWWWSRSLESAMVGHSSRLLPQSTVSGNGPTGTGRVGAGLFPRLLRPLLPANPYGAIVAREVRSLWRDPRRRAGLFSVGLASMVIPVSFRFASQGDGTQLPLPAAMVFVGTLAAVMASNQFGYDGTAYAAQLLAAVPGRTELRARLTALACVVLPVLVVVSAGAALLVGAAGAIPATVGVALCGFGVASGAMQIVSVVGAYPMPQSSNPFAMNTGGGCVKGLAQLVAFAGTLALGAPVAVLAIVLEFFAPAWSWVVLPLGVGYGLALAEVGARLGGRLLDARGPDLLAAVTPRR